MESSEEESSSDDEGRRCCCAGAEPNDDASAAPEAALLSAPSSSKKDSGSQSKDAAELATMQFSDHGLIVGPLSHDHSPHVTDEVFNAASHFVAGMLSILATACMVSDASSHGDPWAIVSMSVYGATLILLFMGSFCHHAIKGSARLMKCLRTVDYVAIYFLIPGTLTPVALMCLHDSWIGWVFFGTSWGLALFGVVMMTLCPLELPMWASMTMYLTLGWFGAFLAIPAAPCLGKGGFWMLLLGGLWYTGGVLSLCHSGPTQCLESSAFTKSGTSR